MLIPCVPVLKCKQCESLLAKLYKKQQGKNIKGQQCLKTKAQLSQSSASRLHATLIEERLKCSQLEGKIKEMRKEIMHATIKIDDQLSVDLNQLMGQNISHASPFMKLF